MLGAAPGARDPGLRRALQAVRQPHPGAHRALPGADGLQRARRRRRHRDHRPVRDHRRDRPGRPAHADRSASGRALWIFGFLQIFSNLGYAVVAQVGAEPAAHVRRHGFEYLATGLGNGAFGVLLLRLTQKRFSATQYALLSSLFTIPRVLAGPPAGAPGRRHRLARLLRLHAGDGHPGAGHALPLRALGRRASRSSAWPSRRTRRPLSQRGLVLRSALIGVAATAVSVACSLALDAIRAHRAARPVRLAGGRRPDRASGERRRRDDARRGGRGRRADGPGHGGGPGARGPPGAETPECRRPPCRRIEQGGGTRRRQVGVQDDVNPCGGLDGLGRRGADGRAKRLRRRSRSAGSSSSAGGATRRPSHASWPCTRAWSSTWPRGCWAIREEARDLSQDVFLQVYRMLPRFEGRSSLKTWIYRIVVNQCRNRQRWWRRRRRDRLCRSRS